VWLAAERVRLALAPGEAPPPPTPDSLRRLSSQLQAAAGAADAGAAAARLHAVTPSLLQALPRM